VGRNREAMYTRMASLGINAVRLNYWTSVDPSRVRDHVASANHRYPSPKQPADVSYDRVRKAEHEAGVLQYVDDYPIVATEHGWNVDDPPQDGERWLRELLRHLVRSSIPAGHNGVCAWMWCWNPNGQVEGYGDSRAIATLSDYGRLWEDEYYSAMRPGGRPN
jgi:hypothetical protein